MSWSSAGGAGCVAKYVSAENGAAFDMTCGLSLLMLIINLVGPIHLIFTIEYNAIDIKSHANVIVRS